MYVLTFLKIICSSFNLQILTTAPLRTYPPAAMVVHPISSSGASGIVVPLPFWTLRQRSQVSLWILLLMIGRWCLWVFFTSHYALWSFMKFLQPIFGHPSFCSFVSTKLFSPKKIPSSSSSNFHATNPKKIGSKKLPPNLVDNSSPFWWGVANDDRGPFPQHEFNIL